MDRVKAQAAQIAQQAQEAAQEGRNRLDQAQASRRGDALLRQLGTAVFAERTGRGPADSQAKIDQLIDEISAYERQNGLDLANPAQPGFPAAGLPASTPGPFGGPQPGTAPSGGPGPFPGPASGSSPDAGGTSFPDPAGTPSPAAGGTPTIDTTTSFFPAPGDDQPG
jgi:hypothetical protein